jgi:hypothetical protein
MLPKAAFGPFCAGDRIDTVDDFDFLVVDLHTFHQGPNDLTTHQAIGSLQAFSHASRELPKLADHEPQLLLFGCRFRLDSGFLLEKGQALLGAPHARLELLLLQESIPISVYQSGNGPLHLADHFR